MFNVNTRTCFLDFNVMYSCGLYQHFGETCLKQWQLSQHHNAEDHNLNPHCHKNLTQNIRSIVAKNQLQK
jgi:hypothetical protein